MQALPDWEKTIPDQETLFYWNAEQEDIYRGLVLEIKNRAFVLYNRIKPIYDAGLLPDRYHIRYLQLETYVTT